ncbi:MAG: hypothetical protein AAB036_03795 [Elusimicrobiota bacterium]
MGRRALAAVLLLGLATAAPAEPSEDAAVRYFRWLADRPNEYKKTNDDTTSRFSRLLFVNASEPQVADFLDETLESLSADPVCERCHLYLAAYASGRPDLKSRALRLLRETTDAGRFALLLNQLSHLLSTGQDSLPKNSPAIFGTMLAEAKLDESVWREKIDEAFRQPHPELTRAMLEAFVRQAKGDEGLKRLRDEAWRASAAKSVRKLRYALVDRTRAQNPSRVEEQDIVNVVRQASEPGVVRFLDEVLDSPPLGETAFRYDPLYAASYASGDARLQGRVVELLRRLIEGTDRRLLRAKPSDGSNSDFGDYHMLERDPSPEVLNFMSYRQEELDLKERSGRALYIFRAILSGASRHPEFLKQAAVELISKLNFDYPDIAKDLEFYAGSPIDPASQGIALEVLKTLSLPKYGELKMSLYSAKQYDRALEIARGLMWAEQSPEPNAPQWFPALFVQPSRPETAQLVREKLASRNIPSPWGENDWNRPGFALLGYASGDPELRRASLLTMRKEVAAPSWNLTPPNAEQVGQRLADIFGRMVGHAWALSEPSERERCAAAVVDFFSELGFDYKLFGGNIEANLRIPRFAQGQPADPARLAVEALILRLKGKDYWEGVRVERTQSSDEWHLKYQAENAASALSSGMETLKSFPPGGGSADIEAPALAQFAWGLFSRTYEPEVVRALKNMLVDAVRALESSAVERWRYRPIILAAYASGDARLKEEALTLIQKRILHAQNPEGMGKRYRYTLEEIAAAVASAPVPQERKKDLFSLAVDFLASLNIPYEAIEGELEFLANRKGNSPEKAVALELIKRTRGGDYADGVAKRARPPKAGYNVYVNGGFSPTSNNPSNEDDLLSFYRGLFKSDAIVLNAGGEPKSAVVAAPTVSTASSLAPFVPMESRLEIDEPYGDGTYENLKATFDTLAKRNPEELTVVFGGHGNQRGVSLWSSSEVEPLSWTGLNHLYGAVAPDTWIKSIFLQCYGGVTVVPLARRVPKRIGALEQFASYYYPANRCALSLSSEDELGSYYRHWDSLFNRYQDLSLRGLQERLYDDKDLHISPVATSDYFLGDVGAALCAAVKSPSGRSEILKLDAGALAEIETGCAALGEDPVYQARARQLEHTNRYDVELDRLLVRWVKETKDEKFSKTLAWWKEVQPSADELYAYHIKSGQKTDYTPAQLQDLMRILATPGHYPFTLEGVFSHSQMLKDEYNARFREFMRLPGNAEKYKDYQLDEYMKENVEGVALTRIMNEEARKSRALSSSRKELERAFRDKQRALVGSWIGRLASLQPVRARYESIRSCEARPLNNER